MRGIDQASCAIAEPARPAGVALDAVEIAPGVGTIDRDHAGGDAFDQEALPAIGQFEPVGLALRAEIGGKVLGRQQAGAECAC